jgi:hypothetical protein
MQRNSGMVPVSPIRFADTVAVVQPTSRRSFLFRAGSVTGAVVVAGPAATLLGACGSSATAPAPDTRWALVQRWPTTSLVPGALRLPVSLADDASVLNDGPAELAGRILDVNGTVVADGLRAVRHGEGLELPYWPFRVTLGEPGIYYLVVDGGRAEGAALQVLDSAAVAVPGVGAMLPPFDTPTVTDARGVDPLCTRVPEPCPLHDLTLTEALASGQPVAYLVGTPAFCQTGTCSPALDALLQVREELGDQVIMVHAEVYTDTTATTVAPAVRACGLDFEPSLFVTDGTGRIVERLDAVFDAPEIRAALRQALS